ncbi:phosphonate metabolism protein/1,5-bisphosphokinase (PRPP-forming) PhnN [Mangrovicoccus sp. HB161399]|uniref:phosphonate metabolism protein/1,5-bisphosphokinase (PRPP-forming) PhnN n=1 Tax=Mangrovicoccus sp. HB161399 TaxID=2720392 RepID=UPI001556298A|nr:phosphonate metabolism protein/1,5-bisphosphokinase (PRPP-forming) PhnN [Mangrovicoccus sp. HB161399]
MAFKGTLFLVAGPSGVGKDTLLDGARAALGGHEFYRFCRRYVTRDAAAGGEDHIPVGEAEFAAMQARGEFFHHWEAHGLRYGLPGDIRSDLGAGIHVIANVSRRELAALAALWEDTVIVSIEASPEVVAARLSARGRESAGEIARRIARRADIPETGRTVLRVLNDGTPEAGIAALVRAVAGCAAQRFRGRAASLQTAGGNLCIISDSHPAAELLRARGSRVELVSASGRSRVAELAYETGPGLEGDLCLLDPKLARALDISADPGLELRPAPSPESREVLRRKIGGGELSGADFELVIGDMVGGRYSQAELAGFLVSAAASLSTPEVVSLARSRAARTENVRWDAPVVVDKHSMGGIPGNRISPIIIPIVAAAGLIMPKTSSRAITSASGTADAMEVLARVDLSPDELRRAVGEAGGCIAWNGNLTHSPVDDVMNAINRPLGLKSARLDVSSILSKKLAAGSTHVLIDMPVGPEAKTRDRAEAAELEALFRTVAAELGMSARVMAVDGTGPVGRGIGPSLEMRDVLAVLGNAPGAPADLREKALLYAGTILDWADPDATQSGMDRARRLLADGSAAARFERILDAQGRVPGGLPAPAPLTREIAAERDFRLEGFGIKIVSAIARAAGAPLVPTAGVDLLCGPGEEVAAGQPLLRIHAATSYAQQLACGIALKALAEGTLARGQALAGSPAPGPKAEETT